jgi:hypothetical protein
MARCGAPQKRTNMAAIDNRCGPVNPSCPVQPPQKLAMQPLPHPSGLPLSEPAVRGRWRAAHLHGQMPPRDPREQHEHDRVETHTIIHTRTPATRVLRTLREQRLDRLPQLVPHPPNRARHRHLLAGLCHPERFGPQRPNPPLRGIETASKQSGVRPRACRVTTSHPDTRPRKGMADVLGYPDGP